MKAWVRWRQVGVCLATIALFFTSTRAASVPLSASNEQEEPQGRNILREATTLPTQGQPVTRDVAPQEDAQATGMRALRVEYVEDQEVLIHTPAIRQHPELKDGCEVTALAMLFQSLGRSGDKMQLAREIRKDPTPVRYGRNRSIVYWGHPNTGFVGAVDGKPIGYGVFHGPITELLNRHVPGQAIDLTGQPFERALQNVMDGKPVIVWTTTKLRPSNLWTSWDTPVGRVPITWEEHAVLLVGYGPGVVYVNDPFDGTAVKRVDRAVFEASWEQLGKQAVSIR